MQGVGTGAFADVLALEAERAGSAMACMFSSSDEYESALIAERRAAGVYGPRRYRKQRFAAIAGLACGVAVLVFLIA